MHLVSCNLLLLSNLFLSLIGFWIGLFLDEQVDGMDAFAVKQACKFAKEHALKNGPIVSLTRIFCFFFPFVVCHVLWIRFEQYLI